MAAEIPAAAAAPADIGNTVGVLGASARAAAFSLMRAGKQVVAADLFADADLARHCAVTRIASYPDDFEPWLADTVCDSWLYTGALENHPELVDRLAALRPLKGHVGQVLRRVRDPMQLQQVLSQAGLHFPETKSAFQGKQQAGGWLGKSCRGSCGSGVGVSDRPLYWQREIRGISLSALFVGGALLGVTRQLVGQPWAGAKSYQYCGSIGPWSLAAEHRQQLLRLGRVLHEEFGLADLYGVDLILEAERIWVIEVNPRYTAAVEVLEYACGLSVFGAPDGQQGHSPVGKVVIYAKAPLFVTAQMHERLMQQAGSRERPRLADLPEVNAKFAVGQPVLTLFAEARSCEAVARRLHQDVIDLQQLLYEKTLYRSRPDL